MLRTVKFMIMRYFLHGKKGRENRAQLIPNKMKNPYLEKVEENEYVRDSVLEIEGYKKRLSQNLRKSLVKRYAWAIPNKKAIETIVEYDPVLEVGAGRDTGRLLWIVWVDIIATDDMSRAEEYENQFYNVIEADASVSSEYPERTLLLC